jgi:hypothetical protein
VSTIAVVPVLGLALAAPSDAGAAPPAAAVIPAPAPLRAGPKPLARDDSDVAARQAAHKDLADINAKLKPLIAADPRAAALIKEAAEISKGRNKALRETQLKALAARALTIRNDALAKSGVDLKVVDAKIMTLNALTHNQLKTMAAPSQAGTVISTTNVTSFPLVQTYKHQCDDAGDTWDFHGADVTIHAASGIADKDCWKLLAGRSASVAVPPGTKSMKVIINAHVDLDVVAMSFGVYGHASGYFGVQAFSPSGAQLGSVQIGNTVLPVAGNTVVLKSISATNSFPNPIPINTGSFAADIQEGDPTSTADFTFATDPGPTVELGLIVGGLVDADLQGLATLDNLITPRSLKVTFYR